MSDLYRFNFPYCLRKISVNQYILLNRNYKPLGYIGTDFIDYHSHPSAFTFVRKPSAVSLSKISYTGKASTEDETIYLYNDASKPIMDKASWESYSLKLKALSSLKIKHK